MDVISKHTLRSSDPMDLRRLAQFVAAADAGSLTSAARSLFITQQAMSSAMRQLEKELGVELFARQGRRVVLTAAGRKLREGAPALLAASDALAVAARRADEEVMPAFVVAHTPAITSEEAFDLIAPIRHAQPDTSITVRQMFPEEMEVALIERAVDVGLRRGVTTPPDLAAAVLDYSTLRLAVDATHPLARRDSIGLKDLAEWTLMVWAPPTHSFYTDFLVSACRRAGFEPNLAVNLVQGTPPVTAVAGNDCVAFVTAPAGPAMGGRVRVLELRDPPVAPIQAIWLPHTISVERNALLGGQ
ncbi:LysR substrate-binding domain-containing protein [Rhodococcus qingshengii]|uniref:LysR substrate-binding domain-containing protein n=1 Tax=Rhodococcus qingshengii TaxID=334542 RepID=UPI001455EE5E|nr:LysR family transcriptional regulator [Rhodococcus qingshengii]